MGDNVVTLTEVRKAFQEESAGLLAKLENKPQPAPGAGAELAQETVEDSKVEDSKLDMHAPGLGGVVATLDGIKVPVVNLSLPIGSALIGGVAGMVVGDVIDRVLPPPLNSNGRPTLNLSQKSLLNIGVQTGGAAAVLKWGPGLMGVPASRFAVGLMALRVLLRVPAVTNLIDSLGNAIATPLAGLVPAGLANTAQGRYGQGIQAEADRIAAGQFNDGVDQFARAL